MSLSPLRFATHYFSFVLEAHITHFAMPLLMKKTKTSTNRSLWPQATRNLSLAFINFSRRSDNWESEAKNHFNSTNNPIYASMVCAIEISKVNRYQWAIHVNWSSIHEIEGDISYHIQQSLPLHPQPFYAASFCPQRSFHDESGGTVCCSFLTGHDMLLACFGPYQGT